MARTRVSLAVKAIRAHVPRVEHGVRECDGSRSHSAALSTRARLSFIAATGQR